MKLIEKDPRVNVNNTNTRNYVLLYLLIIALCGVHTALIILQHTNTEITLPLAVAIQLTFLNLIALALLFVFNWFQRRFLSKPMHLIGHAARQVANGDFSVQIPPQRSDGKKDEFEVIYEDFNAMVAELASNEMLKRDFVSNVSHELKSPLSIIQSYATTLQSDTLTETERQDYADKIVEASKRLSILVSDILQMSRLENQKVSPKKNHRI